MTTEHTLTPAAEISGGYPAVKKAPGGTGGTIAAISDNNAATWDYRTTETFNTFRFTVTDSPGDPDQLVQWRVVVKDTRSTNGRHLVRGILAGTGQEAVQASQLQLTGAQAAVALHAGPWVPGAGVNPDRMEWVEFSSPLSSGAAYATAPKVQLMEAWIETIYAQQPAVAIFDPSGNIEDAHARVYWSFTSNESAAQSGWAWALYPAAVATASGFTPLNPLDGGDPISNGAVAWNKGFDSRLNDYMSNGMTANGGDAIGALLGGSYRVFVWAQETLGSFVNQAPVAFSDFAIVNDPPMPPQLLIGWNEPVQAIELVATGKMNLVPHPWDDNELSDPGWTLTGCTGGRVADNSLEGSYLQRVQSTAGGTITGASAHLSIVSPGYQYRWQIAFGEVTVARTITPLVDWYDASDNLLGTSTGTPVALSTLVTSFLYVTDTAPALAVKARFRWSIAGTTTGQVFTFDTLGLTPGLAGIAGWTPFAMNPRMQMERSTDLGVTWQKVRRVLGEAINTTDDTVIVDNASQQYRALDFEAPRGKPMQYRARMIVETSAGVTIATDWYTYPILTVPSDGKAWLKCPEDPTLNIGGIYVVKGTTQTQVVIDQGVFYPLGLDGLAVVVTGAVHGQDGSFDVRVTTQADYEALVKLVTSGKPLLYQEAHKQQDGSYPQRYIAVKPPSWAGRRAITGVFTVSFVERAGP